MLRPSQILSERMSDMRKKSMYSGHSSGQRVMLSFFCIYEDTHNS